MIYEYKGKKYIPIAYDVEHEPCKATCAFGGNDADSLAACKLALCLTGAMAGRVFTEQTEDNQDAC